MLNILDWLITNIPMFVLIGVTIWYAYSTHKLVQQNTIMISVQKQIDKYEQANLKPVQDIKEKIGTIWLVNPSKR